MLHYDILLAEHLPAVEDNESDANLSNNGRSSMAPGVPGGFLILQHYFFDFSSV